MSRVSYELDGRVGTIVMDDGKVNCVSNELLDELDRALDAAEADEVGALVLVGRAGRFSGGFDLNTLKEGGDPAERMLRGGFEMAARLLSFRVPVVVGCTGHAIAMGVFLVCSGDYRVGADGPFRLSANEVSIGLTVPLPALAILRHRLTPSAFDRAAGLSDTFSPVEAVTAGFLDEVVQPDDVVGIARERAESCLSLDPMSHAETKLRTRAALLEEISVGILEDFGQ